MSQPNPTSIKKTSYMKKGADMRTLSTEILVDSGFFVCLYTVKKLLNNPCMLKGALILSSGLWINPCRLNPSACMESSFSHKGFQKTYYIVFLTFYNGNIL